MSDSTVIGAFAYKVNIVQTDTGTQNTTTGDNTTVASTIYSSLVVDISQDERVLRDGKGGFRSQTHMMTPVHNYPLHRLRSGQVVNVVNSAGTVTDTFRIVSVGKGGLTASLERMTPMISRSGGS